VLAEAKLLRSLEEAYRQHGWDIYDWARQRGTYGGALYGVSDRLKEIIVYYHRSLFESLGLEEPKTLEDLRGIADGLERQGKIPLSFGDK
jgi:raffinose/stachyose/melibiose transport system substrate-binding protein